MTNAGEIHWRNGDKLEGTHRRYFMEHVDSKVTAMEMWRFTMHFVEHNHLGMIDHHLKKKNKDKVTGRRKISRRFAEFLSKIRNDMAHMLEDVDPDVRHINAAIAQWLM